jgi:glycosyltransferase involved in cell wall biosynthesis
MSPGSSATPPATGIRVLLVCDWFLKYTTPLALALRRQGAEVALLCRSHLQEFDFNRDEYLALIARLETAGVDVFVVPGRVSSVRAIPAILRVARNLRKWKPQVAHAQDNHDPRLLMLIRRYPYFFTIHDPILHAGETPLRGLRAFFWRRWIKLAARIVVHGERLEGVMAETVTPDRIVTIPHGTTPRETPLPRPVEPAILLFGRLEPYKGIPVLLEAMKIVWKQRPETRLLVGGKGPERRYLTSDPRIEASLDYIPEAMVESWFERATLVVLPYTEGSQSGVGLQALARGVPVVVTEVGSLPDLALDPSFVVRPGDPSSLAEGLLRHLDHDRSHREGALALARERFSWDSVARKTIRAYERVLSEQASVPEGRS